MGLLMTRKRGWIAAAFALCLWPVSQASADSWAPPIIFFKWNSSVPSAAALNALESQIAHNLLPRLAAREISRIVVSGSADRSGAESYNRRLSLRRAEAVRRYLIRRGAPPSLIRAEAHGETRPLFETADGAREAQNRYVTVLWALTPAALGAN